MQVEQILEAGTDVNEQDAYGETALHLACMSGQADVVRMLVVEQQARMDIKNWEGWVPMIWAIVRGHTDIVKFLADRVRLMEDADTAHVICHSTCSHTQANACLMLSE
jgi:ankyrin repeat protein